MIRFEFYKDLSSDIENNWVGQSLIAGTTLVRPYNGKWNVRRPDGR